MVSDEPWYGVRAVFEHPDEEVGSGKHWYEERVTLWRATSLDEAIELAEAEADQYAAENECESTGLFQAFHIFTSEIGVGTEIFSLIRGSGLEVDGYLEAFFATGSELQQRWGAENGSRST